jgi:hypothetical protein
MHQTNGHPDKPAFFIFGIRPDTRFDLPDIRQISDRILIIAGFPATLKE